MSLSGTNSVYDVAIVGLGPVGAIFANLLARDGLRVVVIERAADIYDKPRAITLDHEALRIFQAIGLGEFMEQAIAPHNGSHYLGVDGEIIKIFDPMPPPFPLGWTPNVTFVQPEAEQALRDRLASFANVDVLLATTGVSLQQNDRAVTLIARREPGEELVVRARYLVGCDGANSFVRKQLDIGLEDLAFDEWWIVVDTR
ncbi:FAD-dependent monooxygenase [Bradyrhizobium genosp. P]|uniref:FAD-dependent monooxygenase n=1 Tax=Bradyrhizobium genosp. P TaxID=83641 RepID=UPI003CF6B409